MSLVLARSLPAVIEARAIPKGGRADVFIEDSMIHAEDFACLVEYWFQNVDLVADDIRIRLMDSIRSMETRPGWNDGGKRLESQHPIM